MGLRTTRPIKPDPVEPKSMWWNCNYGNARTLKLYSGYPLDQPIRAVIPHGIFFETDYVFPGEALAKGCNCVLQWPAQRDKAWSEYKEVVPAAAPYLYALETYPHAKQRRGTVVMPQHSTTLFDFDYDWWGLVDELDALPRPVTVCLYYNDVDRGMNKYFRHKCVTMGHVNDQQFLARSVELFTGAELVVSNDVGSYSLYSTLSYNRNLGEKFGDGGARFRLIHEPPRMVLNQQGIDAGFEGVFHDSEHRHPDEKSGIEAIGALFRDHDFAEPVTKEQLEGVRYWLRADAFKSPEGLLRDLEYCKRRYLESKGVAA